MRICVVQNEVKESIQDTLNSITNTLKEHDLSNLDFLVLPEMFMSPYEYDLIVENQQTINSLVFEFLRDLAIKYKTYLVGGSIPFCDNSKITNTSFVFNRMGEIIHRYDKMHLFEITYPDCKQFSERTIFRSGDKLGIFDTEFGKMGVMICFDIRFPELADRLMKAGANIIFVPAAFNTFTGPMHWETTFKSRAIDNQLFMIGCSPSANSFGEYNYYGHSIICDPLGNVIGELYEEPAVMIHDIDLTSIEKVRNMIPIIKNKKL